MDIAALKEASSPADDGRWVDEGIHGLTGVRLLVRPMQSAIVERNVTRMSLSAGADLRDDDGNLSPEGALAIDDALMAECIVIGWEGFTSEGKPLPYSKADAATMLENSVFWTAARKAVGHVSGEYEKGVAALVKNSETPSSRRSKAAKSQG